MPDLTPEAWAQIRHDYEHSDRSVADICVEHGISANTLRDRVRRWGWTPRRVPIPRQGPPAVAVTRLYPPLEGEDRRARCEPGWGDLQAQPDHPTPTVFATAQTVDPPPPGEGGSGAAPSEDPAAIVRRLQSAVARVLPAIEATIARLSAGPHQPREMEQAGRALSALTRTLRELTALLTQQDAPLEPDDDPVPKDMDEFRYELARRIRAFIEARQAKLETQQGREAAAETPDDGLPAAAMDGPARA